MSQSQTGLIYAHWLLAPAARQPEHDEWPGATQEQSSQKQERHFNLAHCSTPSTK
jgi:hypothetical protein